MPLFASRMRAWLDIALLDLFFKEETISLELTLSVAEIMISIAFFTSLFLAFCH